MAEDYGIVHYKSFTAGDSTAAASAISAVITAATSGYWEIDPDISVASGEVALRATEQTFSPVPSPDNPNNQRIAIRAQASGVLQFAYAPSGWDAGTTTFAEIVATSTAVWTGFRNITGTTTGFGATPSVVWVAQYRDELTASSPYPASTMTVLVGTTSTFLYGAHVGRGVAMDNTSDYTELLYGDCLLVGQPIDIATNFSWLRGDALQGSVNAAIVRSGSTWWSYARVADDLTAANLADVGGAKRLVPYAMYGFGNAKPLNNNTTHAGILGQLKYIRESNILLPFSSALASSTSVNQRWKPMVYDATNRSQYVLWGPETEVL